MKVWVSKLGMEENFWPKKPLVAHVHIELLLGDGIDPGVLLDVLAGLAVKLVELLRDVGAHVAEPLLDNFGSLQ